MTHDAAAALVPAYALDALDRDERALFDAHLATCAACQADLAAYRRVTAGIGLATAPSEPPASLKARTIARATGRTAAMPVAAAPARPAISPWLALAAALVVSAGLGAYAWNLRGQFDEARRTVAQYGVRVSQLRDELAQARSESARLANTIGVVAAPDTIKVSLTGKDAAAAATARAFLSASRGLVFETERLPALPAGKIYQLWVIPPGQAPVGVGVFNVDRNGAASMTIALPAGVAAQVVAVTVENGPTGNPQPTTSPVLAGQVTH